MGIITVTSSVSNGNVKNILNISMYSWNPTKPLLFDTIFFSSFVVHSYCTFDHCKCLPELAV